jgi:hypothetical protein
MLLRGRRSGATTDAMRFRVVGIILVASVLASIACSNGADVNKPEPSSEAASGPSPNPQETEKQGAPTCAPDAPRHYAFLKSGPCSNVAGRDGTWVASSLFPDAPKDIVDTACTYHWTTSTAAPADVDALRSPNVEHLTKSVAETPSCDAPVLKPGSLTPLPQSPNGESAPTGVSGCDVCGRVSGSHVFVILPADKLSFRTVVVATDTGKYLSFEMKTLDAKTQIFSAELPPAPDGAKYNQGRISIIEAAF